MSRAWACLCPGWHPYLLFKMQRYVIKTLQDQPKVRPHESDACTSPLSHQWVSFLNFKSLVWREYWRTRCHWVVIYCQNKGRFRTNKPIEVLIAIRNLSFGWLCYSDDCSLYEHLIMLYVHYHKWRLSCPHVPYISSHKSHTFRLRVHPTRKSISHKDKIGDKLPRVWIQTTLINRVKCLFKLLTN